MKNFKKNHKRGRFRSNGDRNFLRNNGHKKLNTDFTNITDFKRKNPGRNGQNASKLIDKYTVLAREALSNGDKILSENYLQHADHFLRISEKKTNQKDPQLEVDKSVLDLNEENKKTTNEDLENNNQDIKDI